MNEPLHTNPPKKPQVQHRSKRLIPIVHHQALDEATTAPFAAWMDAELEKLEARFQRLATPRSIMRSIRR